MRKLVGALAACLPVAIASAHVTLDPVQGPANGYFRTALRVPHGCSGSPTVRIRVRIPDGVLSVKPQVKTGWTVGIVRTKLATPLDDGHGNKILETISEVSWSGGRLDDAHFDEFGLVMRLPDRPGAKLHFPVVQECEQGVHRWIEIPDATKSANDYREPAPALTLVPGK
jgi:periplasmic copper chaperone A